MPRRNAPMLIVAKCDENQNRDSTVTNVTDTTQLKANTTTNKHLREWYKIKVFVKFKR